MRTNQEQNRTVAVTGATGAIGAAIASAIAAKPGYDVVLFVRDEAKARRTIERIAHETGNKRVSYQLVDISRKASIQNLAAKWGGPLHVLINNAAASPRRRLETPEGIELQFATNVLGYFWLTNAFTATLKSSAPSRVVNVASYWAGNLDLTDLEFKRRPYRNGAAYRQSKQANRMLTVAFAERVATYGIKVNACHPGDVNSTLSNDLGFGGSESPAHGARTPVWLATAPEGDIESGKYYENMRPVGCKFGEDRAAVEALYQACKRY
jgi:NAD(P)-dependent dehydrogenase (short-subunit alcohol dehydrogenase family)